ncbi:MAG: protein kinase [Gemmatimonadaceae bacterium]
MNPSDSPLAQALAGRYTIIRELGRGGMATVYLAEDVRHGRNVAVKVLNEELSAILGAERFLKEITLTASLQHPHILPLFDSGSAGGQLFYVMPYIDGETLRTRLQRERQLPVADAVRIASEAASALDYAHHRGIVHRDVKPENILLQDGHALVADFGIALALQQASSTRMTQAGLSLGTPEYMSPEQAIGEPNIDGRSDIFSLGAVTYEMLAGSPPFTGPAAQAIIAKVITEEPSPLSSQRKRVPPYVEAAVRTALEKVPADRFATAAEFSAALTTPTAYPASGVTWAGQPRRSRSTIVAYVIATVAIIAALWGWGRVALERARELRTAGNSWLTTIPIPDSTLPFGPIAISRNGSRLVFAARGRNGSQLWMRDANTLEPHPIFGTDSARFPTISPDGRRVAFVANRSIRIVSLTGGPVTTLTDSMAMLAAFAPIQWADNDHLLACSSAGIVSIPLQGGAWKPLTSIDRAGAEVFHTDPNPLPGGAVVFIIVPRNYGDDSHFSVAVSDPATGKHHVIMPGLGVRYVDPGYLLVVRPDSSLIAVPFDGQTARVTGPAVALARAVTVEGSALPQFAVSAAGQLVYATGGVDTRFLSLVRVTRDGSSSVIDSTWRGGARNVAVSPDGQRAAISVELGTWDIQVRDLRTGGLSQIAIPGSVANYPAFAADGSHLFLVEGDAQGGAIYAATMGSTAPPVMILRDSTLPLSDPAPSPDGRTLYYVKGIGGRSDIYAHSLDSSKMTDRDIVAGPARQTSPRPSPDGRWLAYASNESGRREIYVRSTNPMRADRWQVSLTGGTTPRWSRDGRELLYFGADSLMSATVSTAGDFSVRDRRALFSVSGFSQQEGGFAVLPGSDGFLMLARRDKTAATPRKLVFVNPWQSLMSGARR